MKATRIILLFVIAAPALLSAQSAMDPPIYVGVSVGMTMRWQEGTMLTTDGYYDCCSFTGGNGIGVAAGARLLYPLNDALSLRAGLGWEYATADFSSERKNYPILGQGNTVEYADFQDDLTLSFPALQVDIGILLMVSEPGLYLTAGPGVTIPFPPGWEQTEQIIGPPSVKYLDGTTSRKLFDTDIPGTRPFISLRFGGGAFIPMTDGITLAPEMLYSIPLMEMQPDFSWSMSGIEITIGVLMRL
ncbi:MAG: hypothetical protein WC824_05075 [Bacteroidota bacterium]|jgi:hypothetical protein